MSPAGVPSFAISRLSWRLHDVQDPQSAEPAKTTSHSFAISTMSSCGAGVEALALRRCTMVRTPYRSRSSAPSPVTRRSKLDFVLSRKPTVRPAHSDGSGGTAIVCVFTTPTGVRTRMRPMPPPLSLAEAGRPREQSPEVLVELDEDAALHADGNRLDGLRAADPVDHEGPREFLGALVGRGQAADRQQVPALAHDRHLTMGRPMVIALDIGTSSARAALYDAGARAVDGRFAQVHYTPRVTRDG